MHAFSAQFDCDADELLASAEADERTIIDQRATIRRLRELVADVHHWMIRRVMPGAEGVESAAAELLDRLGAEIRPARGREAGVSQEASKAREGRGATLEAPGAQP